MKTSDEKPLQLGAINLFNPSGDSEWTVIVGFEQDEEQCGGTTVAHVSAGNAMQAAKVALAEKSAIIERSGLDAAEELIGEEIDPDTMEYWVQAVIPGRVYPVYPYDSEDPEGDFQYSHRIQSEGTYRPDGQISTFEEDEYDPDDPFGYDSAEDPADDFE